MVKWTLENYPAIDSKKVFLVGESSGAMMTVRLPMVFFIHVAQFDTFRLLERPLGCLSKYLYCFCRVRRCARRLFRRHWPTSCCKLVEFNMRNR